MCKLYIASGPLTQKQVNGALKASNQLFASTEKDGFGFLCASDRKVARGRYLQPRSFVGYMSDVPQWLGGPSTEENAIPANPNVLVCHGRTSTNAKGLDNVHPFYFGGHYLAHNGIVNWIGGEHKPSPSCDSEQFLHWLIGHKLEYDLAHDYWAGWGAMAIYDQKRAVLTVLRDGADLSIARRANKQGWVMATRADHLLRVSKAAGIKLDTSPLTFPKRIVTLRNGVFTSSREWKGFGQRQWTGLDLRSYGQPTPKECTPNLIRFPDYEPKGNW